MTGLKVSDLLMTKYDAHGWLCLEERTHRMSRFNMLMNVIHWRVCWIRDTGYYRYGQWNFWIIIPSGTIVALWQRVNSTGWNRFNFLQSKCRFIRRQSVIRILIWNQFVSLFSFEIKVQEVVIVNRLISPSSYAVWKQQFCSITR